MSAIAQLTTKLGALASAVEQRLDELERRAFGRRLWEKDATLWKSEPQHRAVIENRLGWLTVLEAMQPRAQELQGIASEVRAGGFCRAVLLGMGGSSLCPEVLMRTFGAASGFLGLQVLDSTNPASVRAAEVAGDLQRTLFIVSSKSGTTSETLAFYRYFAEKQKLGRHFICITDPGTPLEELGNEQGFRYVLLNPPDLGGRYSALSLFGLVPAALIGLDVAAWLEAARRMATACAADVPCRENPAVRLGAILGEAALAGRDKLTLLLSPELSSLGSWIEQLVAESTGKEQKGLLPVDGEPAGSPEVYGADRLFVSLEAGSEPEPALAASLDALQQAGHPVVRIRLPDLLDLAGEFFRWEVATAVAGSILGINPFDEPNVKESKDLTRALLQRREQDGDFPAETPAVKEGGIALFADENLSGPGADAGLQDWLAAHVARLRSGDYAAWLAYLHREERVDRLIQEMRQLVGQRRRVASTVGYGPRFLHSTGQLHKGGPNTGVFFQLTCRASEDIPIPGKGYGFSVLRQAQARGDLQALAGRGRRFVRLHLTGDLVTRLQSLRTQLEAAL